MSELKKKINYTVVCVNEFANKFHIASKEAFNYLYEHKGKCSIRMKIADLALKGIENGKEKFESMFGDKADSIFIEHILPLYGDVNYDEIDENIKDMVMCGRENVATDHIHIVCHRPFFRVRIAANGLVTSACCDTPHDIVYGDINKESLYENNTNRIQFIYNGRAIEFKNNNTKIEEFFGNNLNVSIQIVTNDLIGA